MKRSSLGLVATVVIIAACHKTPPPRPPVAPPLPPPAPAPAQTATPAPSEYERIRAMDLDAINRMNLFGEIHFDLDNSDIRQEDLAVLRRNADALKRLDYLKVNIEGYCDERGSDEYNLALGERRARAASDYLASMGVPVARLTIVSYGKESSLCHEHTEECWARNRRDHFTVVGKSGH